VKYEHEVGGVGRHLKANLAPDRRAGRDFAIRSLMHSAGPKMQHWYLFSDCFRAGRGRSNSQHSSVQAFAWHGRSAAAAFSLAPCMSDRKTVDLLGVPVDALTTAEALGRIEGFMAEPRLHQIATVNPEFVMAAQANPAFMAVLRAADLRLADGVGLLWAGRWLGRPLPERVAGSDMVYHIARQAAARGWRLFLLGGGEGVAEAAAAVFRARYPGLTVAGTYTGSPRPAEDGAILERIGRAGAEILFVAYGAPQQDLWIGRNRDALVGVRLAMGVGGALDFVTGRARRAPRWLQRAGLEWLHRLWREPWRWRRMLALPQFALRVALSGRAARQQPDLHDEQPPRGLEPPGGSNTEGGD
ncbi:MAG: WecB/TagA/CpsF family glycosyltransferase, partial [Candidatus Promineifilaceae bacterium]